jgi:hypothetical protein
MAGERILDFTEKQNFGFLVSFSVQVTLMHGIYRNR